MTQTIAECNEMIFDFMGCVRSKHEDMHKWEMSKLAYHESWNALMPVVEKIESLTHEDGRGDVNYTVTIEEKYCVISVGGESQAAEHQDVEATKIEVVYNAVINFIKYYNTKDE